MCCLILGAIEGTSQERINLGHTHKLPRRNRLITARAKLERRAAFRMWYTLSGLDAHEMEMRRAIPGSCPIELYLFKGTPAHSGLGKICCIEAPSRDKPFPIEHMDLTMGKMSYSIMA